MSSSTRGIVEKTSSGNSTPRGNVVQLTDQTNRLPFKKLLPIFPRSGRVCCPRLSGLRDCRYGTPYNFLSIQRRSCGLLGSLSISFDFDVLSTLVRETLTDRFSDIFGRKSALALAMGVFMLGNLISGFSKTITQLIVFRGVAGAGGGGVQSMMQIIVSDIVTLRERGKYQGIIGGVIGLGYAIGPPIGGGIIAACRLAVVYLDYHSVLICGHRRCYICVASQARSGQYSQGGVTFSWKSSVVLAPLVSSMIVVGIFCFWEWKGARLPIVPMYIFKHSTVTGVFIAMFINGFVFFSTLYYLPQFFQVALGYDSLHAGLFLVPFLVTQSIVSWLAGMLVSRTGHYRTIVHLGFAIWSVACGCISTIRPGSPKAVLAVYMILAGSGSGQTMQTTTIAVQASVPRRDMSVVTAMRNFIRLLGGTLSLAVASTLVNNKLRTAMTALNFSAADISRIIDDPALLHTPSRIGISQATATDVLYHGYTKGFSALFIMNACMTVCATLVSVLLIKHKELGRGDEEAKRQRGVEVDEKKRSMGSETPPNIVAETPRNTEAGSLAGSGDPGEDTPSKASSTGSTTPAGGCGAGSSVQRAV
ncbi:MFS drug transporter [Mycena venus]|uniref:MFS drug transporter n=1 Tax=Mycena venus TaxID=2733690 RepID=A0A8H6XKZ7_9AGAR|nr:MFS drug transporter [Mycena venus]